MKIKIALLSALLALSFFSANAQHAGGSLFETSVLHEVRIVFKQANYWDILLNNFNSTLGNIALQQNEFPQQINSEFPQNKMLLAGVDEDNVPYLDARITIDGTEISKVGVRFKGYSSYWSSPQFKKSLKIDLNKYIDTANYFGIKKLNLNNGVGDPSMQRDAICYELMRKAGVAAPRTAYAKLYLNDVYWGLFMLVEQVDKTFLEDNFASSKGDLYKNMGWSNLDYLSDNFDDYKSSIALKTNEETSRGYDYVNFVKAISNNYSTKFYDSIQKHFYVDYYFKVMSIDIITKNWDSFIQHGRNFYLYHEPVSDLIYWIPWDYNLALDGTFNSWSGNSSNCENNIDFSFDTLGTKVSFYVDTTGRNVQYFWWSFGDNIWDDINQYIINPIHTYEQRGIYPVSLAVNLTNGCYFEIRKKVILIDTTGICKSALAMNTAYFPSDSQQKVYDADEYCCNCSWDKICDNLYYKIMDPFQTIDDPAYPIDYYSDKLLLSKLLGNSTFKNRYFDIFKYVLDSVFLPEAIFNSIDRNVTLIRDAVYADPNYGFTTDEFEYDINNLCFIQSNITSLKRFIEQRKTGLTEEYKHMAYEAKPIDQEIKLQDIVINEIAANNLDDNSDNTSDWIELYNRTKQIVSLKNFALSDDTQERLLWQFPENTAIMPDGYVIIWADDKDKKNNLHATFKLSANGEDLFLSHKKYGIIDSLSFGSQPFNTSYARFPNGTGPFTFMEPSFNRKNQFPSGIENEEISQGNIQYLIYPNPAADYFTIESYNEQAEFNLLIYNLNGQLIMRKNYVSQIATIDLATVVNGLYIVEIITDKGKEQFKLIVKHE